MIMGLRPQGQERKKQLMIFDNIILDDSLVFTVLKSIQVRKIKILKQAVTEKKYNISQEYTIKLDTKMAIVLNDTIVLKTRKEKQQLANYKQENILSLRIIDKKQAKAILGRKKGKYGAIYIETNE